MLNFNPTILDSVGNYHLLKIQFPNREIKYVLALYLAQKDNYTQSEFPYKIIKTSDHAFNLPSFEECEQLQQTTKK
jgi:hypothetical protein